MARALRTFRLDVRVPEQPELGTLKVTDSPGSIDSTGS
jgi:hypothetical protein